jgi:hypothetical protein
VVPKKLTEDERELFEKLKSISEFNPRRGLWLNMQKQ